MGPAAHAAAGDVDASGGLAAINKLFSPLDTRGVTTIDDASRPQLAALRSNPVPRRPKLNGSASRHDDVSSETVWLWL
jgi:hypothetical protein